MISCKKADYLSGKQTKLLNFLFEHACSCDKVGNQRVIAAIVKRNKLLAVASNSYGSSFLARRPKYQKHALSLYNHAEIAVLRKFVKMYGRQSIFGCSIYIIRVCQTGPSFNLAPAKPCNGCERAIKESGLSKCYYFV